MYKKILIPASGEQQCMRSKKSLQRALEVGDGEIVILQVTEPVAVTIGGEAREAIKAQNEQKALMVLGPLIEILESKGVNFHLRIEPGTIAETIGRIADEEKVDLIIMYSDGRDGISDMLLGSITERVLRNTNVDLLAIRK